jgi:hypothetical protein
MQNPLKNTSTLYMDFLDFINGLPLVENKSRSKRVVLYSIDSLHSKPYIYVTGIQIGETMDAFPTFETKDDIAIKGMIFKGIHLFKDIDYHFYEIPVVHNLEKQTKQCKITLYEILCIRHVEGVPIDPSSILFLKAHSYLCILRDNAGEEIKLPGTFYLSLPKERVKEQLFLPCMTDGIFKKGYYLYTYERCLDTPKDHLVTIPNSAHLHLTKSEVTQRKGHFYIDGIDVGPVPDTCAPHLSFTLVEVTPQWITLKSNKPHNIEEEWSVLRYLCNMEHHWTGPRSKKEYESFSYDQTFKTVNPDSIRCISMSTWTK